MCLPSGADMNFDLKGHPHRGKPPVTHTHLQE